MVAYYLRRRKLCFWFSLFVCPSDNWKSCERILIKSLGQVGHVPGTNQFNFGDDPDHHPYPGVHSGSGKNCHVVNTHRTDALSAAPMSSILVIRITVRIQESEIRNLDSLDYLLCWHSAEVCTLYLALILLPLNCHISCIPFMAQNGLSCAGVPSSNYSLTPRGRARN